jgi:hypothetical protein
MNSHAYFPQLLDGLVPPFQFREFDRSFEGMIDDPWEILEKFEPLDTLNGAIELMDKNGVRITFWTDDPTMLRDNEYRDKNHIYMVAAQ